MSETELTPEQQQEQMKLVKKPKPLQMLMNKLELLLDLLRVLTIWVEMFIEHIKPKD